LFADAARVLIIENHQERDTRVAAPDALQAVRRLPKLSVSAFARSCRLRVIAPSGKIDYASRLT
jgi:hypothetical protein